MWVLSAARQAGTQVLGPNTAGCVTPGECFVGFMPAFNERVFKPGRVGVVSRWGSLGTLVSLQLVEAGLGISAFIGIGGDPIIGTTTRDAVRTFAEDERSEAVIIVGEIGGSMEEEAAEYATTLRKPIMALIAGATSPGKKMGHAGAIAMGQRGSYASKRAALERAGITVVETPSDLAQIGSRLSS